MIFILGKTKKTDRSLDDGNARYPGVHVCFCACTLFLINYLRTLQREYEQLKEQHGDRGASAGGPWESEGQSSHPDEADLLAEAKLLRQHKGRLEARMHLLEDHNRQLESQLHRLRQLLHQVTEVL